MLSPENYIRTRSKILPLYECHINTDWEDARQASCIVARKHTNGNISYCFYFVDLLCLGVKFTHFVFNEPWSKYRDFLAETEEEISLELVDYALVHNVIYAGIEYAEEYEFKPCKDFTSVTQYFLEDDTDDLELMEVDCGGDDGRPVYLHTSILTNDKDKERIIAHLERTAGPGNYTIIDEEDPEDDYFEDDSDGPEETYTQNTFGENREIFIRLFKGLKDSKDPDDLIRLTRVTNTLFLELTDNDLVVQYYDEFFNDISIDVESEELVNELLGVKPDDEINYGLYELFMSVYLNIHINLKKSRNDLELFRRTAGVIPAVAFLELLILQKERSTRYEETLLKYIKTYPDYPLFTLLRLNDIYSSDNVPEDNFAKNFSLDTLFPGRDSLHFLEMFYYLMFFSNALASEENADKMEAFYHVLDEFDLPEDISEIVEETFSFSRIEFLAEYFNLEVE